MTVGVWCRGMLRRNVGDRRRIMMGRELVHSTALLIKPYLSYTVINDKSCCKGYFYSDKTLDNNDIFI